MFSAEGEFGTVVEIQIKKDGAFKRLRGKWPTTIGSANV